MRRGEQLRKRREATSYTATSLIIDGKTTWGIKNYAPFRSRLEAIFANLLNELGYSYEFEKKAIRIIEEGGTKLHYIPDFCLSKNVYVEIASSYSKRMKHKVGLSKLQHPEIKILVLTKAKINKYRNDLEGLKGDLEALLFDR